MNTSRRHFIRNAAVIAVSAASVGHAFCGDLERRPVVWCLDSEPDLAELIGEVLMQFLRVQAVAMSDRDVALKKLAVRDQAPDLMMTDMVGGRMNGIEFMDAARTVRPGHLRFVVCSAVIGDAESFRAVAGSRVMLPDAFVPKPFPIASLLTEVEVLTGARRSCRFRKPSI